MKNLRQRPQMKWLVMDMTQLMVQLLNFWNNQSASCKRGASAQRGKQAYNGSVYVLFFPSFNIHLPSQVCLLQFKAGSFHIAFDKGALDALMGEDTDAASTAGGKLLSEVQKVLDPSEGQYLCVTLGQPHVLGKHTVYTVLAATDNNQTSRSCSTNTKTLCH